MTTLDLITPNCHLYLTNIECDLFKDGESYTIEETERESGLTRRYVGCRVLRRFDVFEGRENVELTYETLFIDNKCGEAWRQHLPRGFQYKLPFDDPYARFFERVLGGTITP